jgi:hypothetical protein
MSRRSLFASPSPSSILSHQQTQTMEKRDLPPTSKAVAIPVVIVFVMLALGVVWEAFQNPFHAVILIVLLCIPIGMVKYFYGIIPLT